MSSTPVSFGIVGLGKMGGNLARRALSKKLRVVAAPSPLSRLITRRVPLPEWRDAFTSPPEDIKVVLQFDGEAT
jgi:hypothetical protein